MAALSQSQDVSVKINDNEKRAMHQEHQQDILRDLEAVIEGLDGLVQPHRSDEKTYEYVRSMGIFYKKHKNW